MFNFFSKHIKLIIICAILIVVVLGIILFLVSRKQTPTAVQNEGVPGSNGLIIDQSNQYLSNDDMSNEDKYLMLLAQTLTEEYGTYKLGDNRGLWDVQNQATPAFSDVIEKIIDTTNHSKHTITTVDPDSISLTKDSNTKVTLVMNAVIDDKNNGQSRNIVSTVNLVQQNTYWLVENIIFSDK